MATTFSALSASSVFRIRFKSSAFAFGAFAGALRAAGFLAGVFFLSDLTVTDFVRADRTGVFGASVLLLWLHDQLLAMNKSRARTLTLKQSVMRSRNLPFSRRYEANSRSIRLNEASMIWFTA